MAKEAEKFYAVIRSWEWDKNDDNEIEYNPKNHNGDGDFTYFRIKENAMKKFEEFKAEEVERFNGVKEVNPDMNPVVDQDRNYIYEWTFNPFEKETTTRTVKINMFEFADNLIETGD